MTEDTLQQLAEKHTPEEPSIQLHGCCSYEEEWRPGVKGWGATDKESRDSGEVSILDYDKLKENMRAAIREAYALGRKQGLEEAAKIADEHSARNSKYAEQFGQSGNAYERHAALMAKGAGAAISLEIRKLIESRKEE